MSALVWPNYPMQVEVLASSIRSIEYDVMFAKFNNTLSVWWPFNNNERAMQFLQVTNKVVFVCHLQPKYWSNMDINLQSRMFARGPQWPSG